MLINLPISHIIFYDDLFFIKQIFYWSNCPSKLENGYHLFKHTEITVTFLL